MLLLVIIRWEIVPLLLIAKLSNEYEKKNKHFFFFTENKCRLFTHKTTNRIITPIFKQNIFLYTRTKWRSKALIYLIYLTDSSGVLIYRVPSVVKIQYRKRVLQQTKCKLNCMQNHVITIHIYHFILNRIHINNIQLSFWNTKLCIQSRTKETPKSVTIKAGRRKCDTYQWCALFFLSLWNVFLEIYHLFG